MGHGSSGEDIYVNLHSLRAYAAWRQKHIDAMEEFLTSSGHGALREARDGAKFGGFEAAQNIATLHAQLTDDMRRLLYEIRGGIETAKTGVEQMAKNYHSVDDQRSRTFASINDDMDERGEEAP